MSLEQIGPINAAEWCPMMDALLTLTIWTLASELEVGCQRSKVATTVMQAPIVMQEGA